MKLVDEKLKEIFEKSNITDIIKAYGYMRASGCYTRAESMSNALYYFDKETVNEYDLVIHREYADSSPKSLEFYKLANVPHLKDYITFCLEHKNVHDFPAMDVHDDAYDLVIEFDESHDLDTMFLLSEFKGVQVRRAEEQTKHMVIDGVIHDGGNDGEMVEFGEPVEMEGREEEDIGDMMEEEFMDDLNDLAGELPRGNRLRDMRVGGFAAPDDISPRRMVDGRRAINGDMVFEGEMDDNGDVEMPVPENVYVGANNGFNDYNLTLSQLAEFARRERNERIENGEEVDERTARGEAILTQLDRIQRLLENR